MYLLQILPLDDKKLIIFILYYLFIVQRFSFTLTSSCFHSGLCPLVSLLQGGSVLGSPFLKGFLAGYVVAKLRSSAILGLVIGTCTGIYAAQNYQVPNIEQTVKEYMRNIKKGPK